MQLDDKMQTNICELGELFKEIAPVQWVVPVYQRHYVWKSKDDDQIPGMWDDWKAQAEKLLNNDETIRPHYFGAIIYSNKQPVWGEVQKRDLVDGQQRLTTFQLAFAALRDTGKLLGYEQAGNINTYISNTFNKETMPKDAGRDQYKLWPSRHDRELFQEIVSVNTTGSQEKSELSEAYDRFCKSIEIFVKERVEKYDNESVGIIIEKLKEALLTHFQVVRIELGKNDDAQQIFASLNGKGEPLSPFDLIRNDIFYRARENNREAETLFENKWFYFEDKFWSKQTGRARFKKARADHFVIEAVIAQVAKVVNQHRIATEYQNYARGYPFASVSEELEVLINYGKSYRALQEPKEKNDTFRIANLLRMWGLSTINPLVLWIDTRPNLKSEEKRDLYSIIEDYIVRRHICGLSTNSLNKTVVSILNKLHKAERQGASIVETFKEFLKTADAETTKMPTDNEILSACEQQSVYNYHADSANKLKYILTDIELSIRTARTENVSIDTNDLSIEHIMPQHWAEHWALKDGTTVTSEDYWQAREENPELDNSVQELMEKRQSVLHTIGNLTLVTASTNSSLSNDDWKLKKEKLEEHSGLKLNRNILKEDEWDEDKIKARSKELADHINEIWPHPQT